MAPTRLFRLSGGPVLNYRAVSAETSVENDRTEHQIIIIQREFASTMILRRELSRVESRIYWGIASTKSS